MYQVKKHGNWIFKWIWNRWCQNQTYWQVKFRSKRTSKLILWWSQSRKQETQVNLQINVTLFMFHIILYSYSNQRYKWMHQIRSLRIFHNRLYTVYYDTHTSFLSTKLQICDTEKHERVKVIVPLKSTMNSYSFLFRSVSPKYFKVESTGIKLSIFTYM